MYSFSKIMKLKKQHKIAIFITFTKMEVFVALGSSIVEISF